MSRYRVANRVGEENGGWKLVTNQLNHERVALVSAQPIFTALTPRSASGREHPQGCPAADRLEWVQAQPRRSCPAEYLN